jgi:putative SOS response-associated peptidase YedK
MYSKYTAVLDELQAALPVCYRFLTEERYNRDMCGRYGFSVKNAKDVYERFDIYNELPDFKPRWNITPGQQNPVITRHSPNQISRMVWGLIPFWAKNTKFQFTTINARVEGIESKATFRKPFKSQRCLVPATGFFEWDKSQKPSQPYYFRLKHEEIFAFAGLYDVWRDPKTGAEIQSYTIITTEANGVVGKIHHRMPVILQKEDEEEWLNPDIVEPERLLPLLKQYLDNEMEAYPVSTMVNRPNIDSAEVIKPLK